MRVCETRVIFGGIIVKGIKTPTIGVSVVVGTSSSPLDTPRSREATKRRAMTELKLSMKAITLKGKRNEDSFADSVVTIHCVI